MTFSIAARDERTGQLGVASASHAYGVGVADHARAGCGAVVTQAFVEVSYGPRGLDLLGMGIAPQEALTALLSADPDREIRQVALVGASGEIAHHTGARCVSSCGAVVAGTSIAIGNMLDGERVLHAVSDAFNGGEGDLADRLLAGLRAGEEAGGDVRGRMSAALRVVSAEPAANLWEGDLRVDFDADPLEALGTHLRMSRAYDVFFRSVFAPGLVTGTEPVTGEELETALAGLRATQEVLGGDMEPTVWQGVLLLRAGEERRGCELIVRAIDARPGFARFVDGLARAGLVPLTSEQILERSAR
ncbi:DUF1028 domain-containing protein [Actinomadura luteofluorescens]|uniref:Putative Ntn-hydrolase superfamily protein n=1 Tax=Actinomadura luteofluorescens TaxID=46163 RepID=A0A7Y9JKW8_9ACTN|nr:DUF1028 domain-containing protein [Actinomadura luteofluorescens]NYD51953.1 putative Ntn-hydrolase superfamily protein [Actinomadura luteofluorescens]